MRLGHIRDVTIGGAAITEQVYLTLDFDWMPDEIVAPALEVFDRLKARATIFVTHQTPLVTPLLHDPRYEVGIHPDYANPAYYRSTARNVGEGVVRFFRDLVPAAVTVHSHDLMQSAKSINLLLAFGIKYDVAHFVPFHSGKIARPFKVWNRRLLRVPYFWEDHLHLLFNSKWEVVDYFNAPGVRVFNFHPLHVYLNTNSLSQFYEALRWLNQPKQLKKLVNTKHYGVGNFLKDIVSLCDP